jgi:hypothetical protein
MHEPGVVSLFINLGTDRSAPKIGKSRQSKYFQHWTLANQGPPRKGQPMNWDIFIDKCFWARVEESRLNSERKEKMDAEVYSRISKFEEFAGP